MKKAIKELYTVGLRSGIVPQYANDIDFSDAKSTENGLAPAEGDIYFCTTSTGYGGMTAGFRFFRQFSNGAFKGLQADLLDGMHAQEIIDAALAASNLKRAWGYSEDGGHVNFELGVVTGASGAYNGNTGFTQIPAFIVSAQRIRQQTPRMDVWVAYANLSVSGVDITARFDGVDALNNNAWWMAVGL